MPKTEGSSALKEDRKYTLAEWRTWPEGERWELIYGVPYGMSPAPRLRHQEQALDLAHKLLLFFEDEPCRVFIAPLDVFLRDEDQDEEIVVEPDVLVVCDPDRIKDDGIHGAPDLVAEVLSDSTGGKDWGVKKELYERSGVKEYWIVHPETCCTYQYVREGGRFAPVKEFRRGESVASVLFPGFTWVCS